MIRRRRPGLFTPRITSDRRSRPMIAGKNSICGRCASTITPGDLIVYRTRNGDRVLVHALCDE